MIQTDRQTVGRVMTKRTTFQTQTFNQDNIECYTPAYAVELLVPYLLKQGFKKIWCPFDEKHSQFVQVLMREGFEVVHTHINTGQDFLTYEPDFEFDAIVSNPPFKNKIKYFNRALSFGKPFCFILSFFTLHKGIYKHHDRITHLLFKNRVKFDGSKSKSGLPVYYLCVDFEGQKDDVIDITVVGDYGDSFQTIMFTPFNQYVPDKSGCERVTLIYKK